MQVAGQIGAEQARRTERKPATSRPTSWWLGVLRKRAEKMHDEYLDLSEPIRFADQSERLAAVKFFNAALRAEESGLRQAHELSDEVTAWNPELSEVLKLYGSEEGWHRELVVEFLEYLGGEVQPMGKITRTFYGLYARAKRMETIVLVNLMFEIMGATTYRLALSNVMQPAARQMLTILTRDESFHVPLNVHFLKLVLARDASVKRRLRMIFLLVFFSMALLPWASRPKAQAFDRIPARKLARAYVEQLSIVFLSEPDLDLRPPRLVLWVFGLKSKELKARRGPGSASVEAAEQAADRHNVKVAAL
jgi:hypothetical protein